MRGAILFMYFVGLCGAQPLADFAGTWVMKMDGQSIFKLTLAVERGSVTGALTKPKGMTIDQDDNITGIQPEQVTQPVEKSARKSGKLVLTIDGDPLVMTLGGA